MTGISRLGRFPQLRPWQAMLLLGSLACGGSAAFALVHGIPMPIKHDEFAYILAGETFAGGRVTNPTHPLWHHFETFHVLFEPSYTSKYPPAQGLLLAAGILLGGHPIVGVWLGMGLMCAAMYWMLLAWFPQRWAALGAALALLQFGIVGYWAHSYWGGALAAAAGALVFGSVRRMYHQPTFRTGLVLGIGLAILANSRPLEGFLASLPAAVVLLHAVVVKGARFSTPFLRRAAPPAVLVLMLAAAGMGYYNWRTTGDAARMPYQLYHETYFVTPPVFGYPLRTDVPEYRHKELERFFTEWAVSRHELMRTPGAFLVTSVVKLGWLLIFFIGPAVVAFVALGRSLRDRWILFALLTSAGVMTASLFTATYPHYVAPVAALLIALSVAALRDLSTRRSRSFDGRRVVVGLLGITALSLGVRVASELSAPPTEFQRLRSHVLGRLAAEPGRDLVLVRYGPGHNVHREWVYNEPDIDASQIVWARDMGPERNGPLLAHFSDRRVWRLEVGGSVRLTPLPGTLYRSATVPTGNVSLHPGGES